MKKAKPPYHVVHSRVNNAQEYYRNRYTVIGPDDKTMDTTTGGDSWFADDICQKLNEAFAAGSQTASPHVAVAGLQSAIGFLKERILWLQERWQETSRDAKRCGGIHTRDNRYVPPKAKVYLWRRISKTMLTPRADKYGDNWGFSTPAAAKGAQE